MSGKVVSIGGLSGAIEEILQEYDDSVKRSSPSAVRRVANKCRSQIRGAATGNEYPGTWATKVTNKSPEHFEITVYSKKPGLPHLLEHGHVIKAYGKILGRTGARVHIKPAEMAAKQNIESELRKIL